MQLCDIVLESSPPPSPISIAPHTSLLPFWPPSPPTFLTTTDLFSSLAISPFSYKWHQSYGTEPFYSDCSRGASYMGLPHHGGDRPRGHSDCGELPVLWRHHGVFSHPSGEGQLGPFQGVHFHILRSAQNRKPDASLGKPWRGWVTGSPTRRASV